MRSSTVPSERCALAIYSSSWAAERARDSVWPPSERIATVPWGANLEGERSEREVAELISARGLGAVSARLRRGRLETQRRPDRDRSRGGPERGRLSDRAHRDRLPARRSMPGRRSYVRTPWLPRQATRERDDRSSKTSSAARTSCFSPPHADCTPLAIAEAASLGLPALATAVGGIPEMVVDGESGRLFPAGTAPQEYRDAVIELLEDRAAYRRLAEGARDQYRARLNWQTAAEQFERLIRERVLA